MVRTLNDLSHLILLIFFPLDWDVHRLDMVPASPIEQRSKNSSNTQEKQLKHPIVSAQYPRSGDVLPHPTVHF